MYNLLKHNIKNHIKPMKNKYKNSFLNDNSAVFTCTNKLMKKLIVTCEEGIEYSKVDFISVV